MGRGGQKLKHKHTMSCLILFSLMRSDQRHGYEVNGRERACIELSANASGEEIGASL